MKNINEKGIEIYFKYTYLDTDTVLGLINEIQKLQRFILETTSPVYFNEKYSLSYRNYLEIAEMHTGKSLKFRLKEGWKPEFRTINGDFEIAIPRKLGIPGIILFFLLSSIKYVIEIDNNILDRKLKQIEIEIKELELYRKMEESKRYKPHFNKTKRQARRTINFILENPDIEYFEINGIEIKNDKDTLPNIN